MLIDTHAHIYEEDFDEDLSEMMARAEEAGVSHVIMPSISQEEYPRLERMLSLYPHQTSAAIGLHPAYVGDDYQEQLHFVEAHIDAHPWVAIGEIGLDYYHSTEYKAQQIEALEFQLDLALEHDLPVIFHVRNAFADIIEVLKQEKYSALRGVIHSFTGTKEELESVLQFPNLMVAINGVATFKNSNLREYIGIIPQNRILVETDAPYLAPVPKRGKRNEPSFIRHTAGHIAELWGMTLDEFARVTTENAKRLFALDL